MAKLMSEQGFTHLWGRLKEMLGGKVDKVAGKQLSTEDFTTELKTKLDGVEDNANNYVHPTSGVEAGTYKSVTVDANGHITAGTNPTTLDGYGIEKIEVSKLDGIINIANLPAAALERLVTVDNETAMLALTVEEVQVGDTVKNAETDVMYRVIDDSKLGTMEAFTSYSAGRAAAVDWSGVENAPTTMANPTKLTIQIDGVEVAQYDGAEEKTINITADSLSIAEISNDDIDKILGITPEEDGE